jgi:hypothetical protein
MENRRQCRRVDFTHEVWLNQHGPLVGGHDNFGDLSTSGAFLRTHGTYAVGRVLELRFRLPSADTFIACAARVRHQRVGHGIGVEFVGLLPETLEQIEGVIGERAG